MNRSLSKYQRILALSSLVVLFFLIFLTGCSQQTINRQDPGLTADQTTIEQKESGPIENPGVAAVVEEQSQAADTGSDESEQSADEFDEFEEEFGDATKEEVFDPLEGYNRAMTTFNDKLYFWVLKPIALCYRWLVPECVRRGVDRMFTNLLYPVRLVNNLLQVKFKYAGVETLRFVTNSTIGVLGFWDPAREWFGLEPHHEDLGQTLGFYGVRAGPHVVLPFFGPSNLRDAFSMYPDTYYLDPKTRYVEGTENQVGVFVFENVNEASLRIGEYESLKKDAVDLYPFLRDGYEQMRLKEIEE
jgi:phospholipid-binding lipoprotein MlaA